MHTALCPLRQLHRLLPSSFARRATRATRPPVACFPSPSGALSLSSHQSSQPLSRALCSSAPLAARAVDCSSLVSPSSASDGHLEGLPLLQRKVDSGKVIEFDSLARVRAALQKDVPKVFPKIEDERLRDLVVGKPNERIDPVFRKAYHPDVLEFLGDRIWNTVTVQTLLILTPRPSEEGGKTFVLGSLGSDISWLVSNDHGAELAKEFKVVHWSGSPCPAKSKLSLTSMGDAWEAHVGALFLANGRQAVLDFLVPLVRREFYKRNPQLARVGTARSASPPTPAKTKQPSASSSTKVAAAPKRPKQRQLTHSRTFPAAAPLPPSSPEPPSTAPHENAAVGAIASKSSTPTVTVTAVDPWVFPWREAFAELGGGTRKVPAGGSTSSTPKGWKELEKAPLVYPSHREARARLLPDLTTRNIGFRFHEGKKCATFTLFGKKLKTFQIRKSVDERVRAAHFCDQILAAGLVAIRKTSAKSPPAKSGSPPSLASRIASSSPHPRSYALYL